MNKTFKGQAADGDTVTIRLGTNNGLTGYRIVKLDGISTSPGKVDQETIIQAFTIKPSSATDTVNFDNPTLIGVCYFKDFSTNDNAPSDHTIIFDSMVFNQDIYLAHTEQGSDAVNYYLELETVKLDLNEATVATLKDMRGRE